MADVKVLEKMLANGRDGALLRFGLGKLYIDNNDFLQAGKHLEACLASDENYSAAWKLLGKARFGLNDLIGAGEAWRRGIERQKEIVISRRKKKCPCFCADWERVNQRSLDGRTSDSSRSVL